MIQKSYDSNSTLYLIPTPIGNLDDITIRALNTIKNVDFLLCEDTRVTKVLLNKYNLKKTLYRCDENSQEKIKNLVLEALKQGKNIGLVSDAGSPIISDPGFIISKYVIQSGYNVVALPGPTAFVPALSMSNIPTSSFIFYGFLNSKKTKQEKELKLLKNREETLIFYESPHRLLDTLNNMLVILGDRNISICREISKIHEEIIRGKISDCINELIKIKGEFVIVVEGNKEINEYNDIDIIEHVNIYMADGMSTMDAIKKVAKERHVAKSIIYKEYNSKNK